MIELELMCILKYESPYLMLGHNERLNKCMNNVSNIKVKDRGDKHEDLRSQK